MVKNNKKPRLRFKGFTDEWEQRKLGEIVEFYSGLTYKPNDIVDDDKETLVLRSCNVQNGEIVENDNVYVTSGVVNSKNVSQGDIIVVVRNGSRDLIGKHAVIKRNMLKTVIGAFMTGISSKYPNFVNSLLSTNQFFIEIEKNLGATINQITTGNFAKMNFTIPIKFDEKIKIGKMFLNLDNLITLHQRKYDKLLNVKKALLDKMFSKNQEKTPKIRFKGFFDAWEQRKLGEIVEFYSGLTYKPNDIVDDDKETLVLRSCNVQNGEIVENDNVYVTSGVVNSKNVSQGDIIVVVRNGSRDLIGKHAVIKRNMLKTVIGAFMTGISSKYPNFVNSLLSTNQFFIEIEKNLGATINQITTGNFAKMNFTIPIKFDEKIKIGKMFLNLDNLITLHQRKCEKLKNIKKALLDKMFV